MKKKRMILLLLAASFFISGCEMQKAEEVQQKVEAEVPIKEESDTGQKIEETERTADIVEGCVVETDSPIIEEETEILVKKEGMEDLKAQLETMLSGYAGDWAVYVKDLSCGEYLEINNHAVKAASLIKLYIMGAVLEQREAGSLIDDGTVEELLTAMITVSDNESSNELVRRLSADGTNHEEGMEVVNAFAWKNGYNDTSQGRDLKDFREVPATGENYTSVKDCGMFLEKVYFGECVSQEASEEILGLLKRQTRTWKIPAGVPEGVVTANKTGELSDTENDVAIVYAPGGDYILCVTSTELPDTSVAQQNIAAISEMVYRYMN